MTAGHRTCLSLIVLLVACLSSTACAATARVDRTDSGSAHTRNIVVTDDHDYGHVEPDLAIDPRDTADLIGAAQFELGPRTRLPGTFASFDGGRTWQDNGVLPLPHGYEQGADTTVAFDNHGNGFVAALLAHGGGGYPSRVIRGGIFVWRTTNGGHSFASATPVYVGAGFQDHPWLALQRAHGRTALLIAWTNRAGLEFTESRDDGKSFAAPQLLVPGTAPSNPVVTVGTAGVTHVFYEEFAGNKVRLRVVTSLPGSAHFGRPQTIGSVLQPASVGGGPKGNSSIPPPLLAAATDPAGTSSAVAIAAGSPQLGRPAIALWQNGSADGAWNGPSYPVNGAVAGMSQQQPRLLIADGKLFLSYFSVSRQGLISEQLARGDTGTTRLSSRTLSDQPFRANGFLGDYQALALMGKSGYALWNNGRSGRLEILAEHFVANR
jgi:hypothetical protein